MPKLKVLLYCLILLVVLIGSFWFFSAHRSERTVEKSVQVSSVDAKQELFERIIDGALVENEAHSRFPVFAFMIDLHPDARPLSGLSRALRVYEMPVEAGIPRIMILVSPFDSYEKIGPIRSARPYFIDVASEVSSVFGHVGGSPDALQLLKKSSLYDLDQFFQYKYFWRATDRFAPHNVYTSSTLLQRLMEEKSFTALELSKITWKDDSAPREEASFEVTIDWQYPDYKTVWKYLRETNEFVRSVGGVEQVSDGQRVTTKNLIVQFTDVKTIDAEARQSVRTLGEGVAYIFMDGVFQEGTWKKNEGGVTRYYYEGNEVNYNRGKTWIVTYPRDRKNLVSVKQESSVLPK